MDHANVMIFLQFQDFSSLPSTPTYLRKDITTQSWEQHFVMDLPRDRFESGSGVSVSSLSPNLLSPGFDQGLSFERNGTEIGMFSPMPPIEPPKSFQYPMASPGRNGRLLPSERLARRNEKRIKYNFCVFCKNNGEDETWFMTHTLKNEGGYISCPVLSKYTCPICSATGPFAHTIRYCPKNKEDRYHQDYAPITMLKTLKTSTGRRRGHPGPVNMLESQEVTFSSSVRQPRPILGQGSSAPVMTPLPGNFL